MLQQVRGIPESRPVQPLRERRRPHDAVEAPEVPLVVAGQSVDSLAAPAVDAIGLDQPTKD